MADKHFGIMALALGLDAVYAVAHPHNSIGGNGVDFRTPVPEPTEPNEYLENNGSLIEGTATAAEIAKLF